MWGSLAMRDSFDERLLGHLHGSWYPNREVGCSTVTIFTHHQPQVAGSCDAAAQEYEWAGIGSASRLCCGSVLPAMSPFGVQDSRRTTRCQELLCHFCYFRYGHSIFRRGGVSSSRAIHWSSFLMSPAPIAREQPDGGRDSRHAVRVLSEQASRRN